jgi:hypothetical protein
MYDAWINSTFVFCYTVSTFATSTHTHDHPTNTTDATISSFLFTAPMYSDVHGSVCWIREVVDRSVISATFILQPAQPSSLLDSSISRPECFLSEERRS